MRLSFFSTTALHILLLALAGGWGCYSFKGISIDPNLKSFAVRTFEVSALNAPPTLAINFSEALKDKIRSETPLALNNDTPDCEFSGRVTEFRVSAIAPKPGETVSRNQLTIGVFVNYSINKEGIKTNYPASGRSFSFFSDFGADQDLLAVQDQLIDEIRKQLMEDIFNAAFNDW
jgi:Lipopolysaccharide-assembly